MATPSHRVGMAVVPACKGETTRTGLILAWPESRAFESPETEATIAYTAKAQDLEEDETYTRIWMVPTEGGDPIPV